MHTDTGLAECRLTPTESHSAIAVTDARSIMLGDRRELRLAAIIAPSPLDSPAGRTPWPPEQAARGALETLTRSTSLAFALAPAGSDRYRRLLGHVFVDDGADHSLVPKHLAGWLQANLVGRGHARVTATPGTATDCLRLLLELEADAEHNGTGLWRHALYQVKPAFQTARLRRLRSSFQIVTGTVRSVSVQRSATYLNFGRSWQTDFTAKLSRSLVRQLAGQSDNLKELAGAGLRVRGWLDMRNGPLITVRRLEQIEVLARGRNGRFHRLRPIRLAGDLFTNDKRYTPE